ncbi:MAG: aldehyde dehydrogenase family protein, partial [Novosphingobium sp.]
MHRMLIGGALESGSRTLDVIDPSTGEVFNKVPDATTADVDKAVAAAAAAFPAWRDRSADERASVLEAMASTIEANLDELADLLIAETGR